MENINRKPKCIIVTGRAGAGKTTLAKKLGERLWLPVISRDAMKEGYVNTFGVKHDELPPDTDALVSDFFFATVKQYLTHTISVVIEAAFQHKVWAFRMPEILALGSPIIVLCSVDELIAAQRHLQRGLENPRREFYHSDKRVVHYRETGEFLLPASYEAPQFDLPTIKVSTAEAYIPCLAEIVKQIQSAV
jgi:hypothetical protein